MSSGLSNTDTGSKPADPFVAKNQEEPSLQEKIGDLVYFVEKNKFCMMTIRTSDGKLGSRCMALANKEGNGADLLFHTNTESGKTDDIQANPEINLGFLNSFGEWASISGHAEVITDREKVREYYSAGLKAWLGDLGDGKHDGGPEDPRIGLIKVKGTTAQYAISRKNILMSAVDIAKGVVTGEVPQTSKMRFLSESELEKVRSGST